MSSTRPTKVRLCCAYRNDASSARRFFEVRERSLATIKSAVQINFDDGPPTIPGEILRGTDKIPRSIAH